MNPIEIQFLPPPVRRRIEKAVGLAKPEREHKVFVYGTLLSNECNCHRAPRARRQRAWAFGTIYDTGYGFPAFVKKGKTRIEGSARLPSVSAAAPASSGLSDSSILWNVGVVRILAISFHTGRSISLDETVRTGQTDTFACREAIRLPEVA